VALIKNSRGETAISICQMVRTLCSGQCKPCTLLFRGLYPPVQGSTLNRRRIGGASWGVPNFPTDYFLASSWKNHDEKTWINRNYTSVDIVTHEIEKRRFFGERYGSKNIGSLCHINTCSVRFSNLRQQIEVIVVTAHAFTSCKHHHTWVMGAKIPRGTEINLLMMLNLLLNTSS
jgi:hypothetical protein